MKRGKYRTSRALLGLAGILMLLGGCSRSVEDYTAEAQSALAKHDLKAAQIALRNALDLTPDDPKLLLQSGQIALQLRDADRAVIAFRSLARHHAQRELASDYLAKALVMQGKPDEALEQLKRVPPTTDIGHAAKVAALFAKNEYDQAFAVLDASLQLFPNSIDLALLSAARANATGNTDRMVAIASELVQKAPDNGDVLMLAGQAALMKRRMADAERYFQKLLTIRDDDAAALISLGGIAADRGDEDKAKAYFQKASSARPGDPLSAALLAQLAYRAGDLERARKILQDSGANDSDLPLAKLLRGLIASRRGSHEEAITNLQHYLRAGGNDPEGRIALAFSQAAVGNKKKALEAVRPVANAANANAATLQLAVKLAQSAGDAEAVAAYSARLASKSKPDPIAGQMGKADAAIRRGDWKGADAIYTGLLANGHSDNLILLNNASSVRLELGDVERAVELARMAHQLAPKDPFVLDTLGWALFKSDGPTPEAVGYLRQAAQGAPSNNNILRHLVAATSG